MTSPTPWSVKGIDPKAREVAKDLARRSGMTLGEWLNRMILEDDLPEEVTSESVFVDRRSERPARSFYEPVKPAEPAPARYEVREHPSDETSRIALLMDRLASRLENSESRTSQAIVGVEHSVRQAVARIEAAEREQMAVSARFEGAVEEITEAQTRMAEGLRRVEAEVAEPRSAQAMKSLEQALGKVAHHLYDGEGRTRELIEAVEARVERIEAGGGGAQDAAKVADAVVGRLAARLAEAEAKTGEALESLRASFAALDGRLHSVESGGSPVAEQRLEHLASELTERVEGARTEMAEKLRASTDVRFDRMELRLGEMADHVRVAEQNSAQAIERIGREVLSVADALNRRVQTAEQQSAQTIEQVSGDVARIATTMETRLNRTDSVHAEALERLGSEIARITERLGERLGAAERRSAQAIDEVGEQVARVTEKLNLNQERASEDLLVRIRQSEERTARLLEDARERIEQQLADTQRSAAPEAPAKAAPEPFAPQAFANFGPPEPNPLEKELFVPPMAAAFPSVPTLTSIVEQFDAADFEAADGFGPVTDAPKENVGPEAGAEPELAAAAPDLEPELPAEPEAEKYAPTATFPWPESMADAEAPRDEVKGEPTAAGEEWSPVGAEPAAETVEPWSPTAWSPSDAPSVEEPAKSWETPEAEPAAEAAEPRLEPASEAEPQRSLTTREVIEQARAAARAAAQNGDKKHKAKPEGSAGGSLFSAFNRLRPKRRSGGGMQTALLVAGGAAALSMAAAGMVVMEGRPGGEPPKRVADALDNDAVDPALAAQSDGAPFGTGPRAAVALSPQVLGPAAAPVERDLGQQAATVYAEAVQALDAQDPAGLPTLRKAANLGHAPAQLYLAKLYETGEGGVKKDLAEARRWTERAADGGDRKAMHNLALYYFEGAGGGPKNTTTAAQWFRRAADLGLLDSQYNLGRLYEEGIGVSQNAAEAYKWYLIAARSGDAESRTSAQRVRGRLSVATQKVVERTAAGYRPAVPSMATASLAAQTVPAGSVAVAQQALSRLGYYQGPADGSASPALRMAVAAYQRDQGMAPSGVLDETTVSRLAVFTR